MQRAHRPTKVTKNSRQTACVMDSRLLTEGNNYKYYTVSQKNCATLFLSELCQISTNSKKFWHKEGKEDKLM